MGAYDRPGVVAERPAHDDARMHGGAVESAVGDLSLPFIPSCLPTTARLCGTDIILSQWIL